MADPDVFGRTLLWSWGCDLSGHRGQMCELPPVGRSRWLRGRVGLALIVLLLPCNGSDVDERQVPSALVVAVDPAEDRPAGFGSRVEPVSVHELAFQR